jgi:hypothetical protein
MLAKTKVIFGIQWSIAGWIDTHDNARVEMATLSPKSSCIRVAKWRPLVL